MRSLLRGGEVGASRGHEAFGYRRGFVPATATLLGENPDWRRKVAEKVEDLGHAVEVSMAQQVPLTSVILSGGTHPAVKTIFIQIVNDYTGLLFELLAGEGRPAMRTARTLVEHAINLRTAGESLANAQRYVDHLEQGRALMMDMELGASLLGKRERRAYLHALRSAGKGAAQRFAAAVKLYGPSFKTRWIDSSLADRAAKYNLADHYRFYRLASLITHGSAGGILGNVRHDRDGRITYRTGPALELAPVAMLGGLRAYEACLDGLALVRPDMDFGLYRDGVSWLLELWPKYLSGLAELDAETWPAGPLRPPVAVLAISRTGLRRWWLHIPSAQMLILAHAPELPDRVGSDVDKMVARIQSDPGRYFLPGFRWVTIAMAHVTVNPHESGRWIPDTSILIHPSDAEGTAADGEMVEMIED